MKPEQAANVGRCGARLRSGRCNCPGFVDGRRVDGWTVCVRPDCGHTQQVHARIEVAAA